MSEFDLDLFVIGGGSGGVRASRVSAGYGGRVAIAEEHRFGGTCVIRGCVPKKLLVYASELGRSFADAPGYGWSVGDVGFDWSALLAAKDREIQRLSELYESMLANAGVQVMHGRARLVDRHTVEVGGKRLTSRYVLVATGSRPYLPDVPGVECAITSDEAFHLEALPESVAVVGGGYIAVEFAHIFNGLGCRTELVHRRGRVLRGFDDDVRNAVTDGLAARGVKLHLSAEVAHIERRDSGVELSLTTGATLRADAFMCATGRVPATADLGLDQAGVALGPNGGVVVDRYSRSSVENIYAAGDCTDRIMLTPVAIREGHAVADTLFGGRPTPVDHEAVPSAVFAQPPAAFVGLTEEQARARHDAVEIYRSVFRPMRNTLAGRDEKTAMKLVVDAASQRVLGVHIVGDDAPEIIQGVAIAVKMGATKADFDRTTALHPTSAEELVLMRAKA